MKIIIGILVLEKIEESDFWDAINMYDQKVKDYTKIEHLKRYFFLSPCQ